LGKRKGLMLVVCAGISVSCASLKPEAREVRLTHEKTDVNACKDLGSIQSWISFSFRDAQNQLKNKASKAGGDTVLVTSTFGDDAGTAYDCRQPQPKK
jgi:hypothetical protein